MFAQAAARSEIRRILRLHNMDYISTTPCHKAFPVWRRPEEILEWIEAHNSRCRKEGRPASDFVEQWVAVDDRPLLAEAGGRGMVGHFVQTHMSRGLTKMCAKHCVDILTDGASASGAASGPAAAAAAAPAVGKLGVAGALGGVASSFSRTATPGTAARLLVNRPGLAGLGPARGTPTPNSGSRRTGVRYQ